MAVGLSRRVDAPIPALPVDGESIRGNGLLGSRGDGGRRAGTETGYRPGSTGERPARPLPEGRRPTRTSPGGLVDTTTSGTLDHLLPCRIFSDGTTTPRTCRAAATFGITSSRTARNGSSGGKSEAKSARQEQPNRQHSYGEGVPVYTPVAVPTPSAVSRATNWDQTGECS
jgi:hypothetical protein